MKTLLFCLSVGFLLSAFGPKATAHEAASKWQTPRYNQTLPYRHFDDKRRYNAAPCTGQTDPTNSYLVKTVVVRKKREPYYYYDANGRRYRKTVLVTTYKNLYSNGSCHVWTVRG